MSKPSLQCRRAAPARCAPAPLRGLAAAAAGLLLATVPLASLPATDLSSVPLPTYTIGSSVDVKPNIMMVLDDSGSMAWDFLPDWAVLAVNNNADYSANYATPPDYLRKNAAFNGVAYNPAVTYLPPVTFDSNGKNVTKYPSITSNFTAVPNDGYKIQDLGTSNLVDQNNAFYTIVAGEYCNSPSLTSCVASTTNSSYQYPAPLRWCNSSALTTCRALWDNSTGINYRYPRIPAPRIATVTINISSSNNRSVSGITVDGLQIMNGASTASTTSSTVASSVAAQINACSNSKPTTGSCTAVGYVAWASGNVVTIYAPGVTSSSPVVTLSSTSGMSAGVTAFGPSNIPLPQFLASNTTRSTGTVPGENLRTVITSSVTSYPYPGTTAKATTRSDCAGTTCTYQEEMTNYANWWAYYRTRMQMMKTATSRAFAALDTDADNAAGTSRYRVGYLSINNNTGSDFANITDFTVSQKVTWFSKLQAAKPSNGTPLRQALSTAGKLYAGKLNGLALNGSTVVDPMQFSCQKNYTILSTDGFWNGAGGSKLDGSSLDTVNVDGSLPRPYNDGGSAQLKTSTSTLQKRTYVLQKSVSTDKGKTWSTFVGASSCTPDNSGTNQTRCRLFNDTGFVTASSCTTQASDANGNTTQCQYTPWSTASVVATCTAVPRSPGPNFTVETARQCQAVVSGGTPGTLADVAAYYYNTDLRDSSATGADATGTCTGPINPPATTPSDLCADNVLPYGRDNNPQQHMTTHTLGLGAQGNMVYSPYQNDLSGRRVAIPDYWQQPTGDFFSVANGSLANPTSGICTWMTSGSTCTWPTPAADDIANIDDLWHAAVNGHGTYFSAQDPASLAVALTSVLSQIVNTPRPGTAAAAASSNPNITSSDNFVFSSSYKSVDWFGELIMQQFNPDGSLTPQQWSAMRLMDCSTTAWAANKAFTQGQSFNNAGSCYLVTSDYTAGATFDAGSADSQNTKKLTGTPYTRTIYTVGTVGASTTNVLIPFSYASLSTLQKSYFDTPYISFTSASQGLTQFCNTGASCMSSTAQAAATGQTLIDFLSGARTYEGTYYRQRTHVLGDIVSSEARYVKQPVQNYTDAGYADFVTAKATRAATVYVGGNDGMLHAFDATNGQERWAFVPSAVLPDLYRLADTDYANKHRYFVDGTPEVGDICPKAPGATCAAADWKTIMVGGLNQGGKAFYALDVTDPAAPKLLWEFADSALGFSYSNPRIAKLRDGTWVVLLATGYNNSDGIGRLYVLNANTGALIRTISTGAGTAGNPSGLTRLAARSTLAASGNNTIDQVYGGDLLGNLYRFDVNDTIGPAGFEAQLLVNLQDANGNPQPITAKPTAASTPTGQPLVIVGTGRYLGVGDLADTTVKYTMYAVKDKLDSTTLTTPRNAGSNFVQQTMVVTTCPADAPPTLCQPLQPVRTATTNPVDWGVRNGWYTDFVLAGERSVTDATLALGTLVFTTIKPQSTSVTSIVGCSGADAGTNAQSFLYYLDYLTGGAVGGTSNVVGEYLCTCIATRPSVVKAQDGRVEGIIRTSGGAVGNGSDAIGSGASDTTSTSNTNLPGDGTPSSDMAFTSKQDLPYLSNGGPPRRISWRELNGN